MSGHGSQRTFIGLPVAGGLGPDSSGRVFARCAICSEASAIPPGYIAPLSKAEWAERNGFRFNTDAGGWVHTRCKTLKAAEAKRAARAAQLGLGL